MQIIRIEAEDTHSVRGPVLRPGRPPETCVFEGDADEASFHLGASKHGRIVAVATFRLSSNNLFKDAVQYQLRGMATLPDFQGKGLGRALLDAAYPVLQQNSCTLLWGNARLSAVPFYEKAGLKTIGDQFEIPAVGPHYVMFKKI